MAKVLVVDDSRISRAIAAEALRGLGHEVVEAADGEEALVAVDRELPDCVVTDLVMPKLHGTALLERFRTRCGDIPTVVVTADIQSSTRHRCAELEVAAFLTKPICPELLASAVHEAIFPDREALACS